MTVEERGDIGRAEESLEVLQEKLADLEKEFEEEVKEIEETIRADELELEPLDIRPRKSDIVVERVALVWAPWSIDTNGIASPAY